MFFELKVCQYLLSQAKYIVKYGSPNCTRDYIHFFYKQHFYKQRQAEIVKKNSKS